MDILTKSIFMFTRLFSLASKPFLLVLMTQDDAVQADILALIFSAVASSFVILSNNNHRDYYSGFLNEEKLVENHRFLYYVKTQLLHTFIFFPFVILVSIYWANFSILIACSICIFVLLEKFFDEEMRLLIYRKKFKRWCLALSLKLLCPFCAYLVISYIYSFHSYYLYFILSLASFAAYICFPVGPRSLFLVAKGILKLKEYDFAKYLKDYKARYFSYHLWAFLSANVILIDRLFIARVGSVGELSTYTSVAMLSNSVLVMHRVIFVEERRHTLVDVQSLKQTVYHIKNWTYPLFLVFLVFVGFLILSTLNLLDMPGNYWLVSALLAAGYLNSVSSILLEWCFWHGKILTLCSVDCFMLLMGAFTMAMMTNYVEIATVLMLMLAGRLCVLLLYSAKVKETAGHV